MTSIGTYRGPLGYNAYYKGDGPTLPIVTWNENGEAMVFNHCGQLVVASEQPGFLFVRPGV